MITHETLAYQSGFGNTFASEAISGSLPRDQNSPQRTPFGLYAEVLSGTAFTAPRAENRRTWTYRLRPSAAHRAFAPCTLGRMETAPLRDLAATPNRLRWNPLPLPDVATDFVAGLTTMAVGGDAAVQAGAGIHLYAATASMVRRVFANADGELLIVPQAGGIRLVTELGALDVRPGSIGLLPRGLRFRVDLLDDVARGYVCENYGAHFRLPELGPIGSSGLADARHFLVPVAAYEDDETPTEFVLKFGGGLWSTELDHSPLDVVAWHGNDVPCCYDLRLFNTIGSVSFDHPDPSIFTVLTSASASAGTANVDFVVFPPRWQVAEHTFRPPWYHRNVMNEYMGLIDGTYDAKAEGFVPGGGSLHSATAAHGPDAATYERAVAAPLVPQKADAGLAFMFESRYAFVPTNVARSAPLLQSDYDRCWAGLPKANVPR